tara:strand:+ start:496 stop:1200 length:705 start_codon:yes stop_codon:yes gene_type:complete
MSASRLPGKPLLKIGGKSIISHVYLAAKDTNIGDTFVATEDEEIYNNIKEINGNAILTNKARTGSDRIYAAYKKLNLKDIDYILNIQGDEPFIDKESLINLNNHSIKNNLKISTLASQIKNIDDYKNESIVKVSTNDKINLNKPSKAKYFFRNIDNKKYDNIYHHIGIYLYEVSTLEKFFNLAQTTNEKKMKLEQLRFIDNNINIDVYFTKQSPIGIDTKEDYLRAKILMESKN